MQEEIEEVQVFHEGILKVAFCEVEYDGNNNIVAIIVDTPNGKVRLENHVAYYFACAITQIGDHQVPAISDDDLRDQEAELAIRLQPENLRIDPELQESVQEHSRAKLEIDRIENAMSMNINNGKHYLEGLEDAIKNVSQYTNRYEHLEGVTAPKW